MSSDKININTGASDHSNEHHNSPRPLFVRLHQGFGKALFVLYTLKHQTGIFFGGVVVWLYWQYSLKSVTGNRGGVTRSKGTWAGSRTRVHCRASAHGSHTLPTELSGTQPNRYLKISTLCKAKFWDEKNVLWRPEAEIKSIDWYI